MGKIEFKDLTPGVYKGKAGVMPSTDVLIIVRGVSPFFSVKIIAFGSDEDRELEHPVSRLNGGSAWAIEKIMDR